MNDSLNAVFSSENRRRLFLRRDRGRSIANRHPWVFTGAIEREEGSSDAAIGDLFEASGTLLASGFHSRHSQIRLRAITFGEQLSADGIRGAIADSIHRRAPLLDETTNAARLVHSEGDGISGLIVDQFADVVVVQIGSAGLDRIRDLVIETIVEQCRPRSIVLMNDTPARKLERLPLDDVTIGEAADEVEITEHGLRFIVALRASQKTGFFLDQRENRRIAASFAAGRRVLNLFSYSGAFGVHAAAAGAESVEEVDSSGAAIDLARRNHALNGTASSVTFEVADAFAHVRWRLGESRSYGLVICDPPAFAKSRGEVDRAARGYKDINLHALRLVEQGGHMLTFSCSGHVSSDLFQKIIFAAALDAHRTVSIVGRLGAGVDHPVSIYCPEGEYLKGLLLRVDA
ncbi:MAG TPA: class I SAM-dependent rRNA methyltransferase [Thermoanaerobaculia bacterium]|nr:class I SAM-dependent rRNA methyltransferase [Thermoanaerobaculia bacterium]